MYLEELLQDAPALLAGRRLDLADPGLPPGTLPAQLMATGHVKFVLEQTRHGPAGWASTDPGAASRYWRPTSLGIAFVAPAVHQPVDKPHIELSRKRVKSDDSLLTYRSHELEKFATKLSFYLSLECD